MAFRLKKMNVAIRAGLLLALGTWSLTAAPAPAGAEAAPSLHAVVTQLGPTLFRAIATDNLPLARSLFYPESAYVALKTGEIPSPVSDYADRLLAFFTLDLRAYHQLLLGHGPVRFLRTEVNPQLATWIPSGVCENRSGYWHEPPVRLVYRQGGVVKSFAIDSMITWQHQWYVIHLGPNPRPNNVGTVDQPENGAGIPGPAGGC